MITFNHPLPGKDKMLVAFLLLISLHVSAKSNFILKKEKDGHTIILIKKGNKLTYDSLAVFNGDTHKIEKRPNRYEKSPVTINGKDVVCESDQNSPTFKLASESSHQFNKYLVDNTKNLWEQLGDGTYGFPVVNIQIDENGDLAYCEMSDSLFYTPIMEHAHGKPHADLSQPFEINESLNKAILDKMYQLLKNMPKLKALQINGIAQPYCLMSLPIVVKTHRVISY